MRYSSSVTASCGVGRRLGLDLELLWLWCRPVAIAPIGPLAWDPPYAARAAQENGEKTKKKKVLIDKSIDAYVHIETYMHLHINF